MAEVRPKLIRIDIKPPLDQVKKRFQDRFDKLENKSVPYRKGAIYLDRWVQQNFKTEGGKVGGWPPFRYGGRLTSGGVDTSAKLLQDTGRLRASFIPFTSRRDAGIGSDIPYSKIHNDGGGRLPQRRMLPTRREVMPDLRKIFVQHIEESFKGMTKRADQRGRGGGNGV